MWSGRIVAFHTRNRLQAVLHRHNLVPPRLFLFWACHHKWWEALTLDHCQKLRVRQDLILLDTLSPLISELEEQLIQLSYSKEWVGQVTYLLQLPGIGVLSAMVILSAIGDITRFTCPKKLVGYTAWELVFTPAVRPIRLVRLLAKVGGS